ncbi:MAG: hypothetical protein ACPG4Z_08440, partial [Chitinophagales bacterium]
MKIFKPRKYMWIAPILVIISGIINLSNNHLSDYLNYSVYKIPLNSLGIYPINDSIEVNVTDTTQQ